MVYEIIVDDSLSPRSLLKESNKFLRKNKSIFLRNNSVFCKPDSNYVISVFDKRIRISLMGNSDDKAAINDVEKYLSSVLNGKTIIVPNGEKFKNTFPSLDNINIVEVWGQWKT